MPFHATLFYKDNFWEQEAQFCSNLRINWKQCQLAPNAPHILRQSAEFLSFSIVISGRVDRAYSTETVDLYSIYGRVKPKAINLGISAVATGGTIRGRAPLTAACALPHFNFLKILFLKHNVTTRQQTIKEKEIITFKHNIFVWRFLNFLRSCR